MSVSSRLPGYQAATPDTLQRRFLSTGGTIHTNGDRISVRLDRRTYSPVLRSADSPTFCGGAAARCIWTTPDPGTRAE